MKTWKHTVHVYIRRNCRYEGLKKLPLGVKKEGQTETDAFEWDKQNAGIYHTRAHALSSWPQLR